MKSIRFPVRARTIPISLEFNTVVSDSVSFFSLNNLHVAFIHHGPGGNLRVKNSPRKFSR
jgi:hypothetical protein